ncbi:chaperone modulator CbpM [Paucibacter soli]|uniref:chaperone modulator CbpM n=1 Tax=Paucibacter soli TaxID=3133433 RepID=UPI003098B166
MNASSSVPAPGSTLLEDELQLNLDELARSCGCHSEWLVELVHEGVIDAVGPEPQQWRFASSELRRARVAWHLTRDLALNAAGAALALDLLDEIQSLKTQLRRSKWQ